MIAATKTSEKKVCSYNGCELTNEEMESPHTVGSDIFCDECYDNWFSENSFDCPLCCECQVNDQQSEYFILFDPDVGEPGIYKILSYPFYSQGLLGEGMFYDHAIARFGFVPHKFRVDRVFSAAFICKECMSEKIKRAAELAG